MTELNVFKLEENKIIICQKLAHSLLTAKYSKVSKRLTATQDSFFPKECAHILLKTVHSKFYWALKLGWFYSSYVPLPYVLVMHHFSAQHCLKKKRL